MAEDFLVYWEFFLVDCGLDVSVCGACMYVLSKNIERRNGGWSECTYLLVQV